ncbi:ATP-binding protein [Kitasatospora camelliae]|uniref:ATP-binding protein n=1 Tax=Kitasatospora camelliae TaxID=3156397 RepID=A0AAU8K3D2_9ACTN
MTTVLPRLPEVTAESAIWLPRRERSANKARVQLRRFLADVEGGELYRDVGELLLTELVTNAVRHACVPPGRLIFARFALTSGLLRIEVHDASSELPVIKTADGDDEAGRGLCLVEQLSTAWGCHLREGGIGKAVWCLVSPATPSDLTTGVDHETMEAAQ